MAECVECVIAREEDALACEMMLMIVASRFARVIKAGGFLLKVALIIADRAIGGTVCAYSARSAIRLFVRPFTTTHRSKALWLVFRGCVETTLN